MSGKTTIMISHNLMTVRDATRIVVLEEGRVSEQDRHEDLMEQNSSYASLYRLHHAENRTATHNS